MEVNYSTVMYVSEDGVHENGKLVSKFLFDEIKIRTKQLRQIASQIDGNGNAADAFLLRSSADFFDGLGWQSIESAPKDGTHIFLHGPNFTDPLPGYWFDGGKNGWWVAFTMPVRPTHWMPFKVPK